MDQPLKQRLIGAAVLAALAVIFLPMLLKGPDVHAPDAAEVPLSMPAAPGQDFETRELPLTVPEPAPAGGVLGMDGGPPATQATAQSGDNTVPGDAVAPVAAPGATAATTPVPAPALATPAKPASTSPPVVKPGTESAATGGGAYALNIGSFTNRANAESLASKLRAAGLPVLSEPVKIAAGDATRLRVGPYADRAAGEAARLRAQSAANVNGTVIALDAVPAKPAAATPPVATPPVATPPAAPKPASPKAVTPALASAPPATPATKPTTPPTSAPASAPVPTPAAAASAGFAVQLSAPAAESDADALRDRARAAGLPSFVQRIDTASGVRYRVRVGPYADRAAAEAALAGVNAKLGTHGIVMRHP